MHTTPNTKAIATKINKQSDDHMSILAAQGCGEDSRMEAYRVIKQIGKGSYGQVFLVKHNGTKKQVMAMWLFSHV